MNIKKDKNGKYYFKISFGFDAITGKRQQTTRRGFKTKKEAEIEYTRLKNNYHKGVLIYNESTIFKDFYDTFLSWYKSQVKETTFINRKTIADRHILSYFKNAELKKITALTINNWQETLIKTGYSKRYIKSIHIFLHQIFERAVRLNIINSNPAEIAGNVKAENKKVEFWTLDEFNKFQAANPREDLRQQMMYYAIHFLFFTGLRIGEFSALQIKDFDGHLIDVNKNLIYKTKDDYYFSTLKTKSSYRIIDLDDITVKLLKEWLKLQSLFLDKDNIEFLFTDNYYPLVKSYFSKFIEKYSKKAGVPRIKVHALRHSHASYLISLGIDILTVSRRLGHASTVETLKTYGHLYPNANEKLISAINSNVVKVWSE